MTEQQIAAYRGPATANYVDERVAAGEDPEVARAVGQRQMDELFPGGRPAPGQHLFILVEGGRAVGSLWIGPRPDQPSLWWVWDVVIDEAHRGGGLGRRAMELAEETAASHGATRLGLNVFGHNQVARHLYESLGYQATAINMAKTLTAPAAE
jgi:GNAT superfamily N-acetyltransferase